MTLGNMRSGPECRAGSLGTVRLTRVTDKPAA
jgi:hypothetical protein